MPLVGCFSLEDLSCMAGLDSGIDRNCERFYALIMTSMTSRKSSEVIGSRAKDRASGSERFATQSGIGRALARRGGKPGRFG